MICLAASCGCYSYGLSAKLHSRNFRILSYGAVVMCYIDKLFLGMSSMPRLKIENEERCKTPFHIFKRNFISIHCQASGGGPFHEECSTRSSADEVRKEIHRCYELIQKLGKGVVYLGSSRLKSNHKHCLQAMELGREVSLLLDCTTWTGAGQGMMDAVMKGALSVKKPVGGFKIYQEAGEWISSNVHPYLQDGLYHTCRFFSARKHGLVDAAVRDSQHERTAFIALPGGIGTFDEIFEILTLMQLDRLGSAYSVPFLLMNYDGFYNKLLHFLVDCKFLGTIEPGEFEKLCAVCSNNYEGLLYLADFYQISEESRGFKERLK